MDIRRFDEGTGIEETLQKNSAKWYKHCRSKFYSRTWKKPQPFSPTELKRSCKAEGHTVSKKLFKANKNDNICFFQCSSSDPSEAFHLAATNEIDSKVRICAKELNDEQILAALSKGDMVSMNTRYHLKCLVNFYNLRRTKQRDIKEHHRTQQVNEVFAFVEIIAYIESRRSDSNSKPLFKLSDLGKMYADFLKSYGINTNLRITDLKERILNHFPSLEAFRSKKNILMIFKDDIGGLLSQAFGIDYEEDATHIAKAASIIRRDVLQKSCEFSGSLEKVHQASAVPESLS